MPFKLPVQQFSFASGMLDDSMEARADTKAYYAGGTDTLNMMGLPQGGIDMRDGFAHVAELTEAATGCILAAFKFSTEQRYLISFTALEIRVYMAGILQATVASPYKAADLTTLDWTQSLDTMIIVHPDHAPRKLVRQGKHTAWALEILTLANTPTYEFQKSYPPVAVTPAAVSGVGVVLNSDAAWFASADIGATIIGNGGTATIASFVSATSVTIDITTAFADTTQIVVGDWSFDMSSASTKSETTWSARRGWSRSIYLREGRLEFGGSKYRPQTSWISKSSDFFDFDKGTGLADEAAEQSLDNDQVAAIQRIYVLDDAFLFTDGGLFVDALSPVTPDNYIYKRHSEIPAAALRPAELDSSVVFVSDTYIDEDGEEVHQAVHELVYDAEREVYVTQDLSLLATSLIRNPVDIAARRGTYGNSAHHLFVVNSDGTLAVLNTRKAQKITGWTLLDSPGASAADQVLRIAVVGRSVYVLVKRTVNSLTRYFIERMRKNAALDCSVTQTSGSPTVTWSGLDHLNGETVHLIGDDAYMGTATVAGGVVLTPYAVSTLEAGFDYGFAGETMPLEAQLSDGTLIGNRHRIVSSTIRFKNTRGPVTVNGREVVFTKLGASLLDTPPPSFSGLKRVTNLGWKGGRESSGATTRIEGRSPARPTILSVTSVVAA